jgi:hypothetical protein
MNKCKPESMIQTEFQSVDLASQEPYKNNKGNNFKIRVMKGYQQ